MLAATVIRPVVTALYLKEAPYLALINRRKQIETRDKARRALGVASLTHQVYATHVYAIRRAHNNGTKR